MFLTFSHTKSHLNWKNSTIGDFSSKQLLHDPKFVDLADLLPDNIRAQEINSKRFWRENCWLVGYRMCCGVSNVTKAQSVNMNPSKSSWCTLFSSPWTFTTIQCFGLPAVSGFLDSHTLLSWPSTPTLILTSTLLLVMSKQNPSSSQAASGSTLSALRWTPFAKVAINYLHWCCDLCPMRVLIQYLHVHGSTPGPLFLLSDGTPLNRQRLTSSSQFILSTAGVPGCYTGHSFCIGTTISTASCGLPDHLTNTLSKRFQIRDLYTHSHHYYHGGSRPTHLTGITCMFLLS